MIPLLKNCTDPLLSEINELKNKHLYTSACMLFMKYSHKNSTECDSNDSFNFTPVKYYMAATKTEL